MPDPLTLPAQAALRAKVQELLRCEECGTKQATVVHEHYEHRDIYCEDCSPSRYAECRKAPIGEVSPFDVLSEMLALLDAETLAEAGSNRVTTCSGCGGSGSLADMQCCSLCGGGGKQWLSKKDVEMVLELQKVPSEDFWKVYDDLRAIGKLAQGVSEFVDRIANMIPDKPQPEAQPVTAPAQEPR
jgi:hypothetical protein